MKNIKKILLFCVGLISVIAIPAGMNAQTPLKGTSLTSAVTEITSDYKPWRSAGWSAQVQSDMLPVSITMKVYMRRDSLTLISLRAPLIGEVARVEIDNSALLVINKRKKRYAKIDLTNYGNHPALIHASLQDILVGRVSVIGDGTLSSSNCKKTDIYSLAGQGYVIACRMPEQYGAFNYGYGVDDAGRMVSMQAVKGKTQESSAPQGMSSATTEINFQLAADITYKNQATADVTAIYAGKQYSVALKNISLEYGTSGFDRFKIPDSYSECDLREAIRF